MRWFTQGPPQELISPACTRVLSAMIADLIPHAPSEKRQAWEKRWARLVLGGDSTQGVIDELLTLLRPRPRGRPRYDTPWELFKIFHVELGACWKDGPQARRDCVIGLAQSAGRHLARHQIAAVLKDRQDRPRRLRATARELVAALMPAVTDDALHRMLSRRRVELHRRHREAADLRRTNRDKMI
jgi:hypothetical protein